MAELMTSNTVKAIIMLGVVALAIAFFYPQLSAIYKSFKSFDDLEQSKKELILRNYDNFVSVVQGCRNADDEKCLCKDAFLSFPNTFSKEMTIEINQDKNAAIALKYNNKEIGGKNATIELTRFSIASKPLLGGIEEASPEYIKEILLDFKNKPYFKSQKSGIEIISGDLYKGKNKNISYFITSSGAGQSGYFSNFPACFDKRKEAIQKFDAFLNEISSVIKEKEIVIDMLSNYTIFYGGKVIKLKYNGSDVERYYENNHTSDIVRNSFLFNVKCGTSPAIADYLSNGDKINVTKTAEGFCIERV